MFLYFHIPHQSGTQSPLAFWSADGRQGNGEFEKNIFFLIGCPATTSIVLPQKSCGNKIPVYPRVSTGAHPLTKKPEDSGYQIDPTWEIIQ